MDVESKFVLAFSYLTADEKNNNVWSSFEGREERIGRVFFILRGKRMQSRGPKVQETMCLHNGFEEFRLERGLRCKLRMFPAEDQRQKERTKPRSAFVFLQRQLQKDKGRNLLSCFS